MPSINPTNTPYSGAAMPQAVSDALVDFLSGQKKPVHLHEPYFTGNEKKYVADCIETGWVSSVGSYVDCFGKDLSDYVGAHAVPVMNGTAALHLCLKMCGIKPGDEVLVPALTFVATANAVSYCGAVSHFVDIEPGSLGVCPEKLRGYLEGLSEEARGKIKALIVTHIFGHPADLEGLRAVCDEFDLVMIEDIAEALGSTYKGRHVGTHGDMAALSFNGNKIMTTGGGGAVITKDADQAAHAKHLTTVAKTPDPYTYIHDEVGYNYRMPNINAALGCAQLESLDGYLAKKRKLAGAYEALFAGIDGAEFMREPENTKSNYWLNTILLDSVESRNAVIDGLRENDIHVRGAWELLNHLDMYKACPKMDLSVAEDLAPRVMNLPSSVFLVDDLQA